MNRYDTEEIIRRRLDDIEDDIAILEYEKKRSDLVDMCSVAVLLGGVAYGLVNDNTAVCLLAAALSILQLMKGYFMKEPYAEAIKKNRQLISSEGMRLAEVNNVDDIPDINN